MRPLLTSTIFLLPIIPPSKPRLSEFR
jgi:hypothetical protein